MKKLQEAFNKAFIQIGAEPSEIVISNRPDISEYQCNGALPAAKILKQSPNKIAEMVVTALDSSVFNDFEVTIVNGFINIKIKDHELIKQVQSALTITQEKKNVVIDYGSPNVAKGMHVGHLRSTLIGAALVNIHEAKGHSVVGDNHLGDWGTPMGIVIAKILDLPGFEYSLPKIESLYVEGGKQFKTDDDFKAKVLNITQELQQGNDLYKNIWEKMVATTIKALKEDYSQMGISFDTWYGESFYENIMPAMVQELKDKNLCTESDGALIMNLENLPPLMLEKTGGGYLYHTSDLACIKFKSSKFDEMLYVVDKRQKMHFDQVFNAALNSGYIKSLDQVKHISFGTINGEDGKPFKTRDGGVLKLKDLIDQVTAVAKAKLNPNLSESEAKAALPIIAMGALKFAELKHQRMTDYTFNLEKFMSLEGFTGPHVLYSGVRAKSILAKVSEKGEFLNSVSSLVEKKLLLNINKFNTAYNAAFHNNEPHHLCEYVYELANSFNSFYNEHHITKETDPFKKKHYLACTELFLQTLEKSLNLLGIDIPEKM